MIDCPNDRTNPLVPDYNHEDRIRRMRLLEMAGGDLKRAMELEQWVQTGSSVTIKAPRSEGAQFTVGPVQAVPAAQVLTHEPEALTKARENVDKILEACDDLDIPVFLDRRKTNGA